MTIAVDFDGTIVTHEYPKIGKELPFATDTLKLLIKEGHKLILWSVRENELLDEAVEWCRELCCQPRLSRGDHRKQQSLLAQAEGGHLHR